MGGVDIATTDLQMCEKALKYEIETKKMWYRFLSHITFGNTAKKYRKKYKSMQYI